VRDTPELEPDQWLVLHKIVLSDRERRACTSEARLINDLVIQKLVRSWVIDGKGRVLCIPTNKGKIECARWLKREVSDMSCWPPRSD
jgi:hypothetical protein